MQKKTGITGPIVWQTVGSIVSPIVGEGTTGAGAAESVYKVELAAGAVTYIVDLASTGVGYDVDLA